MMSKSVFFLRDSEDNFVKGYYAETMEDVMFLLQKQYDNTYIEANFKITLAPSFHQKVKDVIQDE